MTEQEWLASTDTYPMLGFLRANKVNRTRWGRRKLRLFGCGCARRVWQLMSERGRIWLGLGQQCAEGLLTSTERRQVDSQDISLLDEPGPEADLETWRMERTADYAAWFTLASNVMIAATVSAHNAALAIGIKNVPTGRSGVEHAAEQKAQTALLHDLFGNPFRPPSLDPAWLTPTVLALAQTAYDKQNLPTGTLDNARLSILADALEDAGCMDADILNHCRQLGEHVRGCWCVDALLGKEGGRNVKSARGSSERVSP